MERRYYVLAELTEILYVNTKDLIKIRTISIRVISLNFVSFRYKSILVGAPLTSYINIYSFIYYIYIYSFIYYSKDVTQFISFLPWLATELEFRSFGYSNREKLEFTDASQLMFVWRVHVFDVILDRKSPLLSKDIKACGHTYKHTHRDTHRHAHTYAHT